MKLLFLFSGEHPNLPKAELFGVLEGEHIKDKILEEYKKNRLIVLETDLKDLLILNRLALTKKVMRIIAKDTKISRLASHIARNIIPQESKKTFAVRCTSQNIAQMLGEEILKNAPKLKVNLNNPDFEVLCFPVSSKGGERCYYSGLTIALENKNFEKRKPQFRPYFSPTSLHPKIARSLVNLARVKTGDTILDPFCGTGGILIEAALMGMNVIGIDVDEKAVEGCRKNLNFYGLKGDIKKRDTLTLKLSKKVDAIVTDLPYGRSSFLCTKEKNLGDFYEKFLLSAKKNVKVNGHLVMVIPKKYELPLVEHFSLRESYEMYVHKNLSRKILILKKIHS
jgi:tRNA (guanine10-N2)-dimethyltransferase